MRVSLGAYAVDALDPAERARVGAHLECCEDCKGELAELREVAGPLAPADKAEPVASQPSLRPGRPDLPFARFRTRQGRQ